MNGVNILRLIFGSVYVLFLPGFVLTFLFFENTEIDGLERLALGIAFSVATVPLLTFLLSRLGIALNGQSIFLVILCFMIASAMAIWVKKKWIKPKNVP